MSNLASDASAIYRCLPVCLSIVVSTWLYWQNASSRCVVYYVGCCYLSTSTAEKLAQNVRAMQCFGRVALDYSAVKEGLNTPPPAVALHKALLLSIGAEGITLKANKVTDKFQALVNCRKLVSQDLCRLTAQT